MNKLKNLSIILCLFALATITSCSSSSSDPVATKKVEISASVGTATATTTGDISLTATNPAVVLLLKVDGTLKTDTAWEVKNGTTVVDQTAGLNGITFLKVATAGSLTISAISRTNTAELTLTVKGTSGSDSTTRTIKIAPAAATTSTVTITSVIGTATATTTGTIALTATNHTALLKLMEGTTLLPTPTWVIKKGETVVTEADGTDGVTFTKDATTGNLTIEISARTNTAALTLTVKGTSGTGATAKTATRTVTIPVM